jgi:tRNA G18 (ribose-2'-O)-methylase SpoU
MDMAVSMPPMRKGGRMGAVSGDPNRKSAAELVRRYREARSNVGLALLEGFHAVKHALRFRAVIEHAATPDRAALMVLAERFAPDLASALAAAVEVEPALFAALAPTPPASGVVAIARRPTTTAAVDSSAPMVLLENPSDLGNLGAVVRVAAAAGAGAVLTTGRLDPWHPTALRGSAGLHFALPVARLTALPTDGRPIVALDPAGEPLGTQPWPDGAILAFGTERDGLSRELRTRADRCVAIPMRSGVSSLNLATAVAVTLYACRLRC